MGKYTVVYTGNGIVGAITWTSDSRGSLRHMRNNFEAAGNDCVHARDIEPISVTHYTPERGGLFYRAGRYYA